MTYVLRYTSERCIFLHREDQAGFSTHTLIDTYFFDYSKFYRALLFYSIIQCITNYYD